MKCDTCLFEHYDYVYVSPECRDCNPLKEAKNYVPRETKKKELKTVEITEQVKEWTVKIGHEEVSKIKLVKHTYATLDNFMGEE